MNNLYTIGPLYWITRDTGTYQDRILAIGFMRQTSAPWRVGRGLHIRFGKYSFQIGLSKKSKKTDDTEGLLYAMQGRVLNTTVAEIGDW